MKSFIYILEPITNLHVGNGDINYNIIDNEVERDPINGYPIINASGIKGSFRKFIKNSDSSKDIAFFGSEANNKNDKSKIPGGLKFYNGECLGVTMRNKIGKSPYSLVTTKVMLKRFIEMNVILKGNCNLKSEFINELVDDKIYKALDDDVTVEEIEAKEKINLNIVKFFEEIDNETSKNLVIMPHNLFNTISLPVIARNNLDNGISQNLWYEEYVPHHSLFFVCVSSEDDNLLNEFNSAVNGQIVQFGGNATIGYGLTKVTNISKGGDKNEQKKDK